MASYLTRCVSHKAAGCTLPVLIQDTVRDRVRSVGLQQLLQFDEALIG